MIPDDGDKRFNGGKLRNMVDYCFCAPTDDTPRIQEIHITAAHVICGIIEEEVFSPAGVVPESVEG